MSGKGDYPWWLVALLVIAVALAAVIVSNDIFSEVFTVVFKGLGVTVFLPVQPWWTVPPVAAAAALWSWHLYLACIDRCGRPGERVLLTTAVVVQTYLVALTLPTSMFVGGALVGVTYYLAANLLPIGATDAIPAKLVRKYVIYGLGLLALILATARWV